MKTKAEIEARINALSGPDVQDFPDCVELLQWVMEPSPVIHEGAEKERCNYVSDGYGFLNKEKVYT